MSVQAHLSELHKLPYIQEDVAVELPTPISANNTISALVSPAMKGSLTQTSLVFIDSRLPDFQQLLDAVKPGTTAVVLDKNQDGMQQIADTLKNYKNVDSISIISHGDKGVVLLGNAVLHDGDLSAYQHQLQAIGSALKPGGDLLLYGCNIGAGSVGKSFINDLAAVTGANVAASTNDTGATAQQGDWQLEISTGSIVSGSVLDTQKLASWNHLAATLSASDLASLKTAMATANSNGTDDTLTLTGDILFSSVNDTIVVGADSGHTLNIIGSKNNSGGVVKIDAGNLTRVVDVSVGAAASLQNLTITNGLAAANGGSDLGRSGDGAPGDNGYGAGIRNAGNLSLDNMNITANKSSGGGGAGGATAATTGGGGGGGGFGAGFGGNGGDSHTGYLASPASAGHGGNGGGKNTGQRGGLGGSSVGGNGAGAGVDFLINGYTAGGAGGTANNGSTSIGGGGGGLGAIFHGGSGGNAAGGIFNSGTLVITNSSINNNIAAGGGGGGGGASNYGSYGSGNPGGAGGSAVGGIWSTGTLVMDTTSVNSLASGNKAAAGLGGTAYGALNPAGATGHSNDASTGSILAYIPAPTLNIGMSSSQLKAGESSVVTFVFSQQVTGFNNSKITVPNGMLTTVTSVDGTTYIATYTPNSNLESNSNTITVNMAGVVNNVTIAGSGISSSSTFSIDTLAPTLAITSSSSSLKIGETATITFTFSETPAGFSDSDIAVSGGTLSSISGSGKIHTAIFTPDASINHGTASITVAAGTYTDVIGNTGAAAATPAVTFDTQAASVTGVTPPSDKTYILGQSLDFNVSFNEAVNVDITGGTPSVLLSLDTGGQVQASYVSGSGSTNLVFRYIVSSGNLDPTGISFANNLISLHGGHIQDLAGNAVTLDLSGIGNTSEVIVDGIVPSVTAISRVGSASTNASSVQYKVDFSESVTGVDVSDFKLGGSGIGGTISSVTGSGSTYTATISGITGSGNLQLELNSSGTAIKDIAGNNISSGFTGSDVILIDRVAPTVSSITRDEGFNPTTANTVNYTVSFSENVSGVDLNDFIATTVTGNVTGTVASVSAASAKTYLVTVNNITGDGDLRLDLKSFGTGIQDMLGNVIVNGYQTGEAFSFDHTGPLVNNVTSSTADGRYGLGAVIRIQVGFNEIVNVTGTPQLTLETGSTDRVLNYVSGSGSSILIFDYTVQAGDSSADLDYLSTTALNTNGGTIKDALGNNATLTLATPGAAGSLGNNKAIIIGTNHAPVIAGTVGAHLVSEGTTIAPFSTVTITDPDLGALETITITPDIAAKGFFTATSLTATGFSTTDGGVTYTHAAGTPSTLQAAVRGLVFQPASGRVPVGNTETTTFTISVSDGIASAVLDSISTVTASGVNVPPTDIRLSSSTINQGAADNSIVGTLINIDPNPSDSASYVLVIGNGSNDRDNSKFAITGNTLVAKHPADMLPGSYTVLVRAIDAGNLSIDKSLIVNVIDNVSPKVTAINRVNPENNNLASVAYTVSFSETVTGVTTSAFSLTTTGTANAKIASVNQVNGNTYTVQLDTVVGDGTLALTLKSSGTGIIDTAGQPLISGISGQSYQIDHTAPSTAIKNLNYFNDYGNSRTNYVTPIAEQTLSGSLTGALQAGENVQVSIDNGMNWNLASINGNNWSLANQELHGSNTILVRVSDQAGNVGATLSQVYRVLEYNDNGSNIIVTPGTVIKDLPTDGGNIAPSVEVQVPNLAGSGKGDGNGDGIPDQNQGDVSSLLWNNGSLVNGHYVTIANKQQLPQTHVETSSSPTGLPENLRMPYGVLSTELTGITAGKDVNFSLYTDDVATVNGYWVLNQTGDWVNIASNIISVNGKLKLDLKITDGGLGDLDGKADGKISFSGGLGFKSAIPPNPNSSLPGDKDGDGIPDAVELKLNTNPNIKDNDVMHKADLFAMQLYRDILFREGDAAGISYWQQQIDSGHLNRAQVAASMLGSEEFQNNVGGLNRLYFGAFDRLPDHDGLAYWIGQEKAGSNLSSISKAFVASAEFEGTYGNLNNMAFVDRVYQNVLHRNSDAPGQTYWLGQLNSGLSRGDMLAGFTESLEFKSGSQTKVALALDYIGLLGHAPDQVSFNTLLTQGNTDAVTLIGQFLNSPEYLARFMPV